MAKITPSEVKRVVAAMKRRRELGLLQADGERRAQILAIQRRVAKRVQPLLTKAGFDVKKIDTVLAENQKEVRRILEQRPTHADKVFTRIKDTFRHAIDSRVKALELANGAQPHAASTFILLDKPLLIFADPSNFLFDSHVSRKESFAKVSFKKSGQELLPQVHEVTFYYFWENPSENTALVNIATYLVLKGFCEASVDRPSLGNFYAFGDLHIRAELEILEWWNQPPTSPLFQTSQKVEALHFHVNAFGPFSPGETKLKHLFDGYDLKYSLFAVPPKRAAVFRVSMSATHWVWQSGFFQVDFSFKDQLVLCPYLQLELVTRF
jgi:hypothetical protein